MRHSALSQLPGVILSAAVLQAERRISRGTDIVCATMKRRLNVSEIIWVRFVPEGQLIVARQFTGG